LHRPLRIFGYTWRGNEHQAKAELILHHGRPVHIVGRF
jgi:hypothetical protein